MMTAAFRVCNEGRGAVHSHLNEQSSGEQSCLDWVRVGTFNPRFDIWPRPLGEHAWFSVPVIGELMYSIGAVDGTRWNCS